mgnify:CR=1 FL=1
MITVNTKPVRHRFGKVSTEEVRQDSSPEAAASGRGRPPPPVDLCDVPLVLGKVQVFCEVTSHPGPEAGGWPSCELGTHSAAVRKAGQLPRGTDEVFSTICDQMNGSVKRAGHGRRS